MMSHRPGSSSDDTDRSRGSESPENGDSSSGGPESRTGGGPGRPVPVRELMETAREEEASGRLDEREAGESGPLRLVEVEGNVWAVRVAGTTRTGTGSDAGAPLLLLTFARAPESSSEDLREADLPDPEREALAVGTSLDDLPHEALVELFGRSRPVPAAD